MVSVEELEPDDRNLRMMLEFIGDHSELGDYDVLQVAREVFSEGVHLDYSHESGKFVYHSSDEAMNAYMRGQMCEVNNEVWLLGEREGHDASDLGERVAYDWLKNHSGEFSGHWKRTHVFVPVA